MLEEYCKENDGEFDELYLLRNKSKTGIGFFEAGGFYPDFIMWIIREGKQYITFVDPKGIKLIEKQENNPKIMFYKKIKQLEERLSATTSGIVLNSFILSITPAKEVKSHYGLASIKEIEDKNVLFLEEGIECISKLLGCITH